ncbi:hypothetical protein GCM10022221_48840 [Actinocorallia aurea]
MHDDGADLRPRELSEPEVAALIGRWWFAYDHADYPELRGLLDEDVHYVSHSDSGDAPYESAIRCDVRGAEAVTAWQAGHRRHSPFPMRHLATNVHFTGAEDGGAVAFRSYMLVTKTQGGVPVPIASGVVTGTAVRGPEHAVFRSLRVVLDHRESVVGVPAETPPGNG